MIEKVINIGVLAHVDAGKTSLSERLLFGYGALDTLGSVDSGDTRMDSGELERERGITIQSAVAAFSLGALQVNLVDTPGHPDFIAEVERALSVLDGAILVLSAVEGVQAQTRIIMRSLKAARIPTLIFINKIDRMGARSGALFEDIERKLDVRILPMSRSLDEGTVSAQAIETDWSDDKHLGMVRDTLADVDIDVLRQLLEDEVLESGDLQDAVRQNVRRGAVFPTYVGSAITGQGVDQLAAGVAKWLPSQIVSPTPGEPVGRVFAISRNKDGERIAVARLFDGEIRERNDIVFEQVDPDGRSRSRTARVTGLETVRAPGSTGEENVLCGGNIGRLRGLSDIRVGATLGPAERLKERETAFPSPTLEALITPVRAGDEQALHTALMTLSDEDPLIRVRLRRDGALSVRLYGEVQKEVIAERLIREFGIEAVFSDTTALFTERLRGTGRAEQIIDPIRSNDFWATIGLVLEPNPMGAGHSYHREVPWGQMPPGFYRAIEESALETLEQGLRGWPVLDCKVRLVKLGYDRPKTVAADFRCLTPILVMRALEQAGTRVFEPCQTFEIDISKPFLGAVTRYLTTQACEIQETREISAHNWRIIGDVPSRNVQDIAKSLPGLTSGEGALVTFPGKDRVYNGPVPKRPRLDGDPLNYEAYMRYLTREGLMR